MNSSQSSKRCTPFYKKSYDKKTISILALIIPLLFFYSQNKETINWITYNSTIEDANPDSELMILRKTYLINLIIPKFMGLKHPTQRIF
jgi:hypothetical protein